MPEIVPVDVCVEQSIVADFALGQEFAQHHASTDRPHVLAVPVIRQRDGYVPSRARRCIYVLLEVLRGFTAGTAHPALCLGRQIGVRPWCHAQAGGPIAGGRHNQWPRPVLHGVYADPDRVSNPGLLPSCARYCHPGSLLPA